MCTGRLTSHAIQAWRGWASHAGSASRRAWQARALLPHPHLQLLLERQLGALELEQRLLHADGAEQHKVAGALLAPRLHGIERRLVVDAPAVLDAACWGGVGGWEWGLRTG